MLLGIGLSILIALASWFAGRALPLVGAPIFAILAGMVLAALWRRPPAFEPGLRFTGRTVLKAAIVLLGFGMDLGLVIRAGADSLLVLAATMVAAALTATLASRLLGIGGRKPLLIGVGTAICGGSAIAAVAPVVGASDEEVAESISTIFLFNIVAVFLFPALGHLLGLSDRGFGMWAGTAINDSSSVLAAAYSWSDSAGDRATVVKLTRTLLIIPLTLVLSLVQGRGRREAGAGKATLGALPWFVPLFALASLPGSLGLLPPAYRTGLAEAGKFLIVMAMAAIGLNTNLARLLKRGARPLALGLATWTAVALASLAAQALGGDW